MTIFHVNTFRRSLPWIGVFAALVAALAGVLVASNTADAARPVQAAQGNPNSSCPDGTVVVAKYELTGGGYVAEFGGDIVSVSGDADSATFTSSEPIFAVVVKGGTDTKTVTFSGGATTGTVTNVGLVNKGGQTPVISNLQFCGGVPYTEPQ